MMICYFITEVFMSVKTVHVNSNPAPPAIRIISKYSPRLNTLILLYQGIYIIFKNKSFILGNNIIGDNMITDYEIKYQNGEQILYLHFDFNNEFGKFKIKEKTKELEQYIKEFIKKNNIVFKGTTVAIIASGMIIGNIVLSNDSIKNNIDLKQSPITIVETLNSSNEENIISEEIEIPQIDEQIKEETKEKKVMK